MPESTSPPIENVLETSEARRATGNVTSALIERTGFEPPKCKVFHAPYTTLETDDTYTFRIDREAKTKLSGIIGNRVQRVVETDNPAHRESYEKPRKIGIVFSGGPAPGGHNVIAGLFDAAKKANPDSTIYGFLMGPDGIIENEAIELTRDTVDRYRNIGGFSMIKTGRTKIDTPQKMTLSRQTCRHLGLNALVVVGGDDSNTNAAFLAQEMLADGIQVIGVPKTIDGDIQVRDDAGNVLCAMSFGFHSAARAFAGAISNLCTDGSSDVKYWHICKVMGRVASHLALEVALQTHANMTFIGEELADYVDTARLERAEKTGTIDYTAYGMTLRNLSRVICEGIVRRAAVGKNYGVMVIPEGILEFINEIQIFIVKLNTIIAEYNATHDVSFHQDFPLLADKLEYLRRLAQRSRDESAFTVWNTRDEDLFNDIPDFFQEGLLMERDSHGNFPFSQVETEKVLMDLVKDYLKILQEQGHYRIGIRRDYFIKTLRAGGMEPETYGHVLFSNWEDGEYLLMKADIISLKTLKQALLKEDAMEEGREIPPPIQKIYKKSVPDFKIQTHFYGYDGRGSDPTYFDCLYTYNLGLTVFSLIANGATGQMAAIKNLEHALSDWEPIGIPIAPLMHLEERKGKLALVIERSIVDLEAVAFQAVKANRESWLAAFPGEDNYRHPGPVRLSSEIDESRPLTLLLNALSRRSMDV